LMPILTICQTCGAQVSIPKSVVKAARAAQCPNCKTVLTGPTVAVIPDKRPFPPPAEQAAPPTNQVSIGRCRSCGALLSVPPEALGRWIQCSQCGEGLAAVAEDAGSAEERPQRGIPWRGVVLAAGAVVLIMMVVVIGSLMLGGNPTPTKPVR